MTHQGNERSLRPYVPESRIDEVESRIREFIADNDLQPGDRLPGESWFAAQLGVGRPLIREAMKGLEAVGAIEVRRGVGRFVREFDPDTFLNHYAARMLVEQFTERELVETRCLLEIAMAPDAVLALTDEDLVEIDGLWDEIQRSAAEGRSGAEADIALHRVIMRRADNRLIVAMLDAVHALVVGRTRKGGQSPEQIQEDLGQHGEIVRAAKARDSAAIRDALIRHFETTARRLGFRPRWRYVSSTAAARSG